MSAWTTTVGRLRRARPPGSLPVAASRAAAPLPRRRPCRRRPGRRPSAGRTASDHADDRPARAIERALDHGVLVLGKRPGQGPAPVVEAEEAPGVEAGRPLVGLVPCGQRELADLLGGPVRRLFGQLGVRLGLGHLDEGLDLVERELSLGERIGDLGERRELGGRRHPFACGGGGDAAPLDEPGHHGGGAVDSPGPPAVQLGHRGQKLALVCRDRPMMLGDARDEGFGPPRHGGGRGPSLTRAGAMQTLNGRRHAATHERRQTDAERVQRRVSDTGRPGPTRRGCAPAVAPAGG